MQVTVDCALARHAVSFSVARARRRTRLRRVHEPQPGTRAHAGTLCVIVVACCVWTDSQELTIDSGVFSIDVFHHMHWQSWLRAHARPRSGHAASLRRLCSRHVCFALQSWGIGYLSCARARWLPAQRKRVSASAWRHSRSQASRSDVFHPCAAGGFHSVALSECVSALSAKRLEVSLLPPDGCSGRSAVRRSDPLETA